MKLIFDLTLERLLSVPRGGEITLITIKAGSGVGMELNFYDGKVSTAPDFTPVINFIVKTAEAGDVLAWAQAEVWEGNGAFYGANLFTNTEEMVSWLGGQTSKMAVAELAIFDAGADLEDPPIRSQTLNVRVTNHVLRGDEGVPGTLPTADAYVAARAVCYDRVQALTSDQKIQAQNNIGLRVTLAGNVIDNACLALIDGKLRLVLRHQDDNTWHEFTIVDSTEDPGTPTYNISNPL